MWANTPVIAQCQNLAWKLSHNQIIVRNHSHRLEQWIRAITHQTAQSIKNREKRWLSKPRRKLKSSWNSKCKVSYKCSIVSLCLIGHGLTRVRTAIGSSLTALYVWYLSPSTNSGRQINQLLYCWRLDRYILTKWQLRVRKPTAPIESLISCVQKTRIARDPTQRIGTKSKQLSPWNMTNSAC